MNTTLIFSLNQALLASRAGAAYVSPFVGRLDDIGEDGAGLVEECVAMLAVHELPTEVIAASLRGPSHVSRCALAGAQIATLPFSVIEQMLKHPLTDRGIEAFLRIGVRRSRGCRSWRVRVGRARRRRRCCVGAGLRA